ncbi:MAG: (2Fe-2S)-binding protein [Acidimicrobiales bacterium]|nr:(2Fe-2S)-binding protein [Acidimicrobiales bacterium]
MLVCHCEDVNDRRIVAEVGSGARCPDLIAERCGAGSRCGGCRPTIEALLASLGLAEQPAA